jgi:adenylosuccinate synthase
MTGWESIPDHIWDKGYNFFPETLKQYIRFIEEEVNCPIKIISVGPQRHETVIR